MAIIASYVIPLRLYRYRSLENGKIDRELDAVRNGYLYCSEYKRLNDPMEGLFTSSRSLSRKRRYKEILDAIVDKKNEIGICSFSEVYNHELMWAHYASQFKGVCIAYNLSLLCKRLPQNVAFVRMYYNEKIPTIGNTNKTPKELARMVLSYKNYKWLYEREWRMLGRSGELSYQDTDCVTRVYLGSRIDPDHRDRIITALSPTGIKIFHMKIDAYAMTFSSKPGL